MRDLVPKFEMKMSVIVAGSALVYLFAVIPPAAAAQDLIAWWKFDEGQGRPAVDGISQKQDTIVGNFRHVPGVSGTAVKFDGFTTHMIREAAEAPRLSDAFSIEAWVAPQAYPWNWCATANQEKDHEAGYFFGIDHEGRVGLHLSIDGKWRECTTDEKIPFMKWSHIAATFKKDERIVIYINGKEACRLSVKGTPTYADSIDFQIGRNLTLLPPAGLTRPRVRFPAPYSFDGIIDELKIYDIVLPAEEIRRAYEERKPDSGTPLEWRKLPELPDGGGTFGAAYTHLKFFPEWDALWRVADHPDIVVNFDDSDCKMVFWRGTNYNMNLVTENGKWVGDQSAEGGGGDVIGCCEHMSDKQCRYAHVRLIENHDARVVVHWRYALCDVQYRIANSGDGWGAWADEYYYIYPDRTAVRHFTVYNVGGCSITEPTVFSQPGEKPEDNVFLEAVTLANPSGQTRTYSFETWPGSGESGAPFINVLPNANMTVVNLKSQYRPFYIYEPGTRIIPYGGGTKEVFYEYSHFHAKNHWPTCLMPTDGRRAWAADRVTSSAITSPEPPMERRAEDGALVGRFIMGLTRKPAGQLTNLARSWLKPAALELTTRGFSGGGYSGDQCAYILNTVSEANMPLEFRLAANEESPVVNPCFVIKNWSDETAVSLKVNGQPQSPGPNFRQGIVRDTDGSPSLVVWLNLESATAVDVELAATHTARSRASSSTVSDAGKRRSYRTYRRH